MTSHDASSDHRLEEILPKLVAENDALAIEKLIGEHSTAELSRAVSRLDDDQRGHVIDLIDAESAADLVPQLPSVQAVQLLGVAEAGGLMVTELLRYPEPWPVHEVVADLQAGADRYGDYQIQYAYACTREGQLD